MKLRTPIHFDYFVKALTDAIDEQSMAEKSPKSAYHIESKEGDTVSILLWQGVTPEGNLYFDAKLTACDEGTQIEGAVVKHPTKTDGATRAARYLARATMALIPGALCYVLALAILFAFGVESFVLPLIAPVVLWIATAVHNGVRRARTEKRLLAFLTKVLGATQQD
jgi:hypothetical protein